VLGQNLDDAEDWVGSWGSQVSGRAEAAAAEADEPGAPVMPSPPPFPTFTNCPSLPHQLPGNGFESGRDSRAR
jgi:hypothetical protein